MCSVNLLIGCAHTQSDHWYCSKSSPIKFIGVVTRWWCDMRHFVYKFLSTDWGQVTDMYVNICK